MVKNGSHKCIETKMYRLYRENGPKWSFFYLIYIVLFAYLVVLLTWAQLFETNDVVS